MPIDHKEVNKSNRSGDKNKFAVLKTDRAWLTAVVIGLSLLSLYNTHRATEAVESAKNSREVVWVKMWADGKTSVSEFVPEEEQPIVLRTINSALSRFIETRYQIHPETIKQDYAEAGVFMGDSLFTEFTDQNGYYAAQKASDIANNPAGQARVNVSNVRLDHYDQIEGDFSGEKKPIVRTTITWDESSVTAGTQLSRDNTKTRMMRVTWTLLDRSEISKKSTAWLKLNPAGIVILSKQELDR